MRACIRFRVIALVAIVVASACGGDDDTAATAAGDLEAFCAVMTSPPPMDAFRNPEDEAARAELDEHAADAERTAPDDIRDDAAAYRLSVQTYLEGLASGDQSSDSFREAQAEQLRAGRVINDYIDANCDDFANDDAVEHRPVGELTADPVLQQQTVRVLVGPGDSDTQCVQIGTEPAAGPSCHAKPRLEPGGDSVIVLVSSGDVVAGLVASEIRGLSFEMDDGSTNEAKLSSGVFSATLDTDSVTAVHADAGDGIDVRCEIWDSPLFQITCEP